jgi:hypothetical protein
MNYSRRQLYALGEPLGESATRLKVGGRIYGGGGGIPIVDDILDAGGDIIEGVGDVLGDVVGGLGDGIGEVVGGVGDVLGDIGNGIDDFVNDNIPGGWTTLAEVGIAMTPLGAMGAAGFGALSGGTNKFKGGFDLSGAIMGGLQGYGVGSLTTSLASAGAATPTSPYDLSTTTGAEVPTADVYGSGANSNLQSATPNSAGLYGGSAPVDYSLSNVTPPGIDPASASQIGYTQNPINPGQLPTAEGITGITNPNFGSPPPPSGLASLGNTMATNASNAGQGIQNLVGAGPQGLSGIMPAASAVNAGMSYTAYSGLGALAMQTIAEKEAEKFKNEQQFQSGAITNEEYQKNQVMIDEAIARARETVSQYPYEPEPEQANQQEALYPRKQRTLYDDYGLQNLNSQEVLYDQDSQPQYAVGGTVDGNETPDTLMAGGITNAFNFNSGGQMPMYAMGGEIPAYGFGGYIHDLPDIKEIIRPLKDVRPPAEPAPKAAEISKAAEAPTPKASRIDMPKINSDSESVEYLGPLLYEQRRGLGGYSKSSGYGAADQFAQGGQARFLSGGGDGMSDSIHANIDGKQEARLADGEFVIPADVVSHLGNGSSKAGAKQLHAMMDRIRKARTGNHKQGKQINPTKFMPA